MIWGSASPPMAPTRWVSPPGAVVTSMGERVWGGRRPGPTSAGWPSMSEKPTPRLWRKTPVVGSTRWEPKSRALDCVSEIPRPSASMAHRCVVSPWPIRATAGPVVPPAGRDVRRSHPVGTDSAHRRRPGGPDGAVRRPRRRRRAPRGGRGRRRATTRPGGGPSAGRRDRCRAPMPAATWTPASVR